MSEANVKRSPVIHPARLVAFDELIEGLDAGISAGAIVENRRDRLSIFHYSDRCTYDGLWDRWSLLARGLVLDRAECRVVATPFPKFFNFGEGGNDVVPKEPFEVFEKVDGSLGIVFHHDDRWNVTTKGAFGTPQAAWAETRLAALNHQALQPGDTYLFEIVFRANRIVVEYPFEDLVLIGGYAGDGREFERPELEAIADRLGCRIAPVHRFSGFDELFAAAEALGRFSEGFVVRFESGFRLKLKGEEYCRIHRLVSRVTPLGVFELLEAGDDLETVRRMIPEEFWSDFDAILDALRARISEISADVDAAYAAASHLSDKEIGLALPTLGDRARAFLFSRRRYGPEWMAQAKPRAALFRMIRPAGNVLDGYAPSSALDRIRESG